MITKHEIVRMAERSLPDEVELDRALEFGGAPRHDERGADQPHGRQSLAALSFGSELAESLDSGLGPT
jgi:hypothetical protein